jgi:hypothetical protein
VIPKGGYRLDDMLDDDVESGDAVELGIEPSAEGYAQRPRGYREPSAEVRESAAVYAIRRSARELAHVHR